LGFIDFGQHGAGRARIQANGVFGRKKAQKAQKGLTANYTKHAKGRARHFRRRMAMAGQAVRAATLLRWPAAWRSFTRTPGAQRGISEKYWPPVRGEWIRSPVSPGD
jgi:hypothetical protein